MITKAPHPIRHPEVTALPKVARAYFACNQLKLLYRQGWLRVGLKQDKCESVAEHSYGVAMLAMWLADTYFPDFDSEKILRLALIHDLGEAFAGDITPADGIDASEKYQQELAAMRQTVAGLVDADVYLDLWEEYEQGASPEARFIRSVDRLEMALQARIYELEQGSDLSEFFDSAAKVFEEPPLLDLFQQVLDVRQSQQSVKRITHD